MARICNDAWRTKTRFHVSGLVKRSTGASGQCVRASSRSNDSPESVRAHRELLLSYFKAKKRFSSGIIEGLNNKAKVTMRKVYGYRTFRIAERSLHHVLGRLPEPKLAHRFF